MRPVRLCSAGCGQTVTTHGARCVNCELAVRKGAGNETTVRTWSCTGGCGKGMPAPGAKCPDCILARQRERQQPAAASHEEGRARNPEEAQARDRAILDRLKAGPASFEQLAAVVPVSGEISSAARESAARSSLLRLKVKNLVKISTEGYALA